MKITKRKDPDGWRIHIDGKPTSLLIAKDFAPRFREPQMYNLFTDDDHHLLQAPGVGAVMERLERIAKGLGL